MQKSLIILAIGLLSSCTFKKVENHYHTWAGVSIITHEGAQSVSGSDPQDSLNGNKPSINLKGN